MGRECGRSAGKEASPNFRAAGLGAMCLESPRTSRPSLSLSLSLSLSFTPWYPLCLAHLPSSSIASTEAPFPRASVPLSSLFFSRYPCLSFFYVGLSFSYSSSESSTQPLRGASRRSRVSARAFRLAVQRILG